MGGAPREGGRRRPPCARRGEGGRRVRALPEPMFISSPGSMFLNFLFKIFENNFLKIQQLLLQTFRKLDNLQDFDHSFS